MKWITKYFVNQALKKPSEDHSTTKTPFRGNISRIGIIAPSLVELHDTEDLLKTEFGQKIEVSGLFYGEGAELGNSFSYRDFSLSGKPKEKISRFIENKPDVIVATSENLDIFSLYLLYLSPQPYIIGFYQDRHKHFLDLMLTKDAGHPKENMEHLIKYLKQVIIK